MLNSYLDQLVRPEIHIFRRSWSTFRMIGTIGLGLAIVLAMVLVLYLGLSPAVMAVVALSAVLTFVGLAMTAKIITGEERLTYYHHHIAVLAVAAVVLWMMRQPLLPYLDVTILGVGLFLACGRIGCLMVGCCHGRPHRWGVCYREEHVAAGFTPHFVGVRLFPIQAVESLWVFLLVLAGSVLVVDGSPPGMALCLYVVAYAGGRFFFEFVRGDPDRPYLWGFSEAQWTSLTLVSTVVLAGLSGVLPVHAWHASVLAGLVLTMALVSMGNSQQSRTRRQLFHPHHVKEVATALARVANPTNIRLAYADQNPVPIEPHVERTSLGIQISASRIKEEEGFLDHYALSLQDGLMTKDVAQTLAGLILQLQHASGPGQLINGRQLGVYHLLVPASVPKPEGPPIQTSDRGNGAEPSSDLRQEIAQGLLYAHSRLNANTSESLESSSFLYALIQLLSERDIIAIEDLEERQRVVEERMENDFKEQGMAVLLQKPECDKYTFEDNVEIDCENRIHLCKASCCRLHFALSKQDVWEGVVRWNLHRPYMNDQGSDGYCNHIDHDTLQCAIYEHRPIPCRAYDCREDKRIWLDFARMIPNPALHRSDWPGCVEEEGARESVS